MVFFLFDSSIHHFSFFHEGYGMAVIATQTTAFIFILSFKEAVTLEQQSTIRSHYVLMIFLKLRTCYQSNKQPYVAGISHISFFPSFFPSFFHDACSFCQFFPSFCFSNFSIVSGFPFCIFETSHYSQIPFFFLLSLKNLEPKSAGAETEKRPTIFFWSADNPSSAARDRARSRTRKAWKESCDESHKDITDCTRASAPRRTSA